MKPVLWACAISGALAVAGTVYVLAHRPEGRSVPGDIVRPPVADEQVQVSQFATVQKR